MVDTVTKQTFPLNLDSAQHTAGIPHSSREGLYHEAGPHDEVPHGVDHAHVARPGVEFPELAAPGHCILRQGRADDVICTGKHSSGVHVAPARHQSCGEGFPPAGSYACKSSAPDSRPGWVRCHPFDRAASTQGHRQVPDLAIDEHPSVRHVAVVELRKGRVAGTGGPKCVAEHLHRQLGRNQLANLRES